MDRNSLTEILLEQQKEANTLRSTLQLVEREKYQQALKLLKNNLIKIITGVRRSGKSVFSLLLTKGIPSAYINFDDERLISLKTTDLSLILELLQELHPQTKTFIFDEIQNVTGWELFANRLKRQGYNLIITGSNSKLLSHELATHLTGRHLGIELFPFSWREYLLLNGLGAITEKTLGTENRAQIFSHLKTYFEKGGFPEIYLENVPHGQYLRELFDKIVSRDIVLRYGIRYGKTFKELALYALTHYSTKVSYQNICGTLQMKSVHTVKNYFQYLEEAYLLFQVYPYSLRMKEQLKQPKKIYSIDLGLSSALSTRLISDLGLRLENLVFLELKRRGYEIFTWTDPTYEVDFLIRDGGDAIALIQVCYDLSDMKTKKREVHALVQASKKVRCDHLWIITWEQETEIEEDSKKIRVFPVWKWLLQKWA